MREDDENQDDDYQEYEQREQKIERLIAKNYQSKIRGNPQFIEHLTYLKSDLTGQQLARFKNLSAKEQQHQLIIATNDYLKHIDNDILIVHKQLRDAYEHKFSELESIILNPLDFSRAVKEIGNVEDITRVIDNLNWLPNQSLMSVTVAFSASSGRQLSEKELQEVVRIADEVILLNDQKAQMLNYLETRMSSVAPNVSAIVGTRVAAKLIAAAGGIGELAKIPASNIQVLGSQKKALHGMSTASAQLHRGVLTEVDMYQNTPPQFQMQVVRMLSSKTALAARMDSAGASTDGKQGQEWRQGIMIRFGKISTPQQAKLRKALPKPDDKPRRKRGGKKFRNMRLKYQVTQARKMQNIIPFGEEGQKEFRDTGFGMGMIGMSSGKLKVGIQKNQNILNKKKFSQQSRITTGGSGVTNGLASSIAMSTQHGMELLNPDILERQVREAQNAGNQSSYFNSKSGFNTVLNLRKSNQSTATQNNQSTYNQNMIL
eukprot:403353590